MAHWKYDFTGRTIRAMTEQTQNGEVDVSFDIDEQISEAENTCPAQQHVVVFAHRSGTDSSNPSNQYMLKIRYDVNPKYYGIDNVEEWKAVCENHYLLEMDVVRAAYAAGHGPRLIDWRTNKQGPDMPYPKGLVDIYVTARPPGEILGEIYLTLEDEHLRIIRAQLASLLEQMRLEGFILHNHHPNYLTYDKANKKGYLFDFTFYDCLGENEKTKPITEKDSFVLAFGIWPPRLLRERVPEAQHL